jgi:glucokinase
LTRTAIGIDIGGTNIRLGLVDELGNIIERRRYKTEAVDGVGAVVAKLKGGMESLMEFAADNRLEIRGAGIGIPGIISSAVGVVHFSPNLPGWVDIRLKDLLEPGLGFPVMVENDANVYALGEARFGAGMGVSSQICMTLGTGVGGGIILDDRIWRGVNGMAGEVGHMTVDPEGPLCGCGNRGCLERYSSATAVLEMAARAFMQKESASQLNVYKDSPASLTTEIIADAASNGDKLAIKIYSDVGRFLGIAIANIVNLLNIERVVIGGGLTGAWDLFIGPLKDEVAARAFDIPARSCDIVPGQLGDDAGILGAAGLVLASRE